MFKVDGSMPHCGGHDQWCRCGMVWVMVGFPQLETKLLIVGVVGQILRTPGRGLLVVEWVGDGGSVSVRPYCRNCGTMELWPLSGRWMMMMIWWL